LPDGADPTELPVAQVSAWLATNGVEVAEPMGVDLIAGGRSNLTYALTGADGARLVLRRPPLSGVIASAHDVLREGRIMAALADTPVPVPAVLASCADTAVLGAPFIVMDYVDGVVLTDRARAEATLDERARGRAATDLVDALVQLHAVLPEQVGLGDLGRGEGYVERQLRRWSGQLDKLGAAGDARMRELHERLAAAVPEQQETTIVHGDFRAGNTIVGPDGRVRAVLDWELATLGDPLADLGWLVAYWGDPGAGGPLPMPVPTTAAGFGPAGELVTRYSANSGRSVAELDYYIAFALWRLAAVLAGVQARARQGAYGRTAGAEIGAASGDERIQQLLAAAAAAAGRSGR
jgi:aminoglycoside phosphotransferase (APT) family kinase protein